MERSLVTLRVVQGDKTVGEATVCKQGNTVRVESLEVYDSYQAQRLLAQIVDVFRHYTITAATSDETVYTEYVRRGFVMQSVRTEEYADGSIGAVAVFQRLPSP